jgi:beta-1,2-mannobiose phosphorylase / 1,2-beta-oligomannan phosphorylase
MSPYRDMACKNVSGPKTYNPAYYTSGGGWGGSEDPRTVMINNKVYMIYVAFEGWDSVRMALTSIKLNDFKKGKWNWRKPRMISPPGTVAKNWVIFPEKINGKFAILHGVTPDILIDYVDNLDTLGDGSFIISKSPRGGRKNFWDNRVRGAGPPPVKTDKGWLLLYHAMDINDPNKYKLGAMILDLNDPTKIIYRSPQPILNPDMHYENDGKPGVIYATGAAIINNDLFVYYGGGDKHVCIAQTPLDELLNWLVRYGKQ